MELRDWLVIIVIPGISALFVWYTTRYLPAKQAKENQEREFNRASETESLGQVIKINETIVSALVRVIDDRFSRLENDLSKVLDILRKTDRALGEISVHVETHSREVIRNNEVQADIDLLLHEIKSEVTRRSEHEN